MLHIDLTWTGCWLATQSHLHTLQRSTERQHLVTGGNEREWTQQRAMHLISLSDRVWIHNSTSNALFQAYVSWSLKAPSRCFIHSFSHYNQTDSLSHLGEHSRWSSVLGDPPPHLFQVNKGRHFKINIKRGFLLRLVFLGASMYWLYPRYFQALSHLSLQQLCTKIHSQRSKVKL